MKLGKFTRQVSDTLARGNSLDKFIPDAIRRAAKFIEKNNTLFYMNKFGEVDIDSSATNPRQVDFPNSRVKAFNFVRIVASDVGSGNEFKYLNKVKPEDIPGRLTEEPTGYWLDGDRYLYLDTVPNADFHMELGWVEYTDWSTDPDFEPWLLKHADALLEAQTIVQLASVLKDKEAVVMALQLSERELKTLLLANDEFEESGESVIMGYN